MHPLVITSAAVLSLGLAAVEADAPRAAPAVARETRADQLLLPAPKAARARPLVVVLADNAGAETTDFTIPYGVLKESGVADVRAVSTAPGPVQLMLALKVMPDQTIAQFDAAEPAGADIVIVPAQMKPKSPELAAWIKAQAGKGAVVVSVCEGARVLAHAGLLAGKRATTHWYSLKALEKAYPETTWVRDRRYVQDGRVISTTGVSASIPVSLALVEAIAGRRAAEATARRLGVPAWSAAHHTADFHVSRADFLRAATAMAAPWTHETVETPIADGADEIALALTADAWQRSYKTRVVTTRAGLGPVRSRRGLTILPDAAPKPGRFVIPAHPGPPAPQLALAIADMGQRYGPSAARLARLGMEDDPPSR